ncbi:LysR family transcriptional regulator [Hahella sp. KA22]|uniref:LysR family transcriptional regulator n=1 Tax=Hahella sp. KA22 TaxID=1628392 RepID=UPI000FDD2A09|nr:LysR family transcriptional regulator [Hahella sp. KA22]AZZ95017.1 LysR family transcriptional regulator [Hahella sp. KA22]QAY52662.1 LysR family transcriptional regulator [Hahella sp. KA22]
MDLRALRYYVAAVETGSITAAAEQCHVAQPSISLAVSKLESELDTLLLERGKKGVRTTRAGRELHHMARRLLAQSDALVKHFQQSAPLPPLRIGLDLVVSLERVKALLARLAPLQSRMQLELLRGEENTDIRIVSRDHCPENYHFSPLWRDEYCLLLPANHPLSLRNQLGVSDLNGIGLVERSFCDLSGQWRAFAERHQLDFAITARTDNEEWALALVAAGVGACLAPQGIDASTPDGVIAIPLSQIEGFPDIKRELGLAWSPLLRTEIKDALLPLFD